MKGPKQLIFHPIAPPLSDLILTEERKLSLKSQNKSSNSLSRFGESGLETMNRHRQRNRWKFCVAFGCLPSSGVFALSQSPIAVGWIAGEPKYSTSTCLLGSPGCQRHRIQISSSEKGFSAHANDAMSLFLTPIGQT
jgi:hypothetical protein